MVDPILIEEIIRPADQGLSRPYLCRGEDGHYYYVKGINTTRQSQVYEWICGHLAHALGLPVAEFAQVEIVPELLEESPNAYAEIGVGIAFGSRQVEQVSWFEPAQISNVPRNLRRDLAVFDWWIRNSDRTEVNTNLLWKADTASLAVIDHNCAFDDTFDGAIFLHFHVFKQDFAEVIGDLDTQARYYTLLQSALPALDEACATLPQEWFWHDEAQTVEANFSIDLITETITRCNNCDFWRAP